MLFHNRGSGWHIGDTLCDDLVRDIPRSTDVAVLHVGDEQIAIAEIDYYRLLYLAAGSAIEVSTVPMPPEPEPIALPAWLDTNSQ